MKHFLMLTLTFEELFILFTQANAIDQNGPEPGPKLQTDRLPALPKVCDMTLYFTSISDECLTFFPNAKHRLQKICRHFLPNWTNPRRQHPLGPQCLKWLWMAGRWSTKKNPLWQICRLRLKNWKWFWTCYRGDMSEYSL